MSLMIGKQLSEEQRLTKAVVDILGNPKYQALAGVLMIGKREVSDKVPTACTNGRDEKYGRAFIKELNDAELRFVVLHECYHKLYKHLITWKHLHKQNAKRANRACDYVINIKIADDNKDKFATMPRDANGKDIGLIDDKYRGMDSAQVFKLLDDEDEDDEGGDGDFDDHDWDGAQDLSDEERKELERDIDEAVRQGALAAGKVGAPVDRDLRQLMQPKINWRDVLREFLSTACAGNDFSTWARPNRRFISTGYYMPSGQSQKVGDVVLANDMSGSIDDECVAKYMAEAKSFFDMLCPDKVHLLYWDTEVRGHEIYNESNYDLLLSQTRPKGGGGTDPSCIPLYLNKHGINPKAVVVLTDGYVSKWGTWSHPVMWCIVNGFDGYAPVGKTLHIND